MSDSRAQLIAKLGAVAVSLLVASVVTWEGYSARVTRDPIGRLQVCYGHDDQSLTLGQAFSPAECRAILDADLLVHADVMNCIAEPLRAEMSDGMKAALVSLAYNVGVSRTCASTFVKRINAGDGVAACEELSKWVYAGGKDCRIRVNNCFGIVKRRAYERQMCEAELRIAATPAASTAERQKE